jgi:ketosteroid isomerase-like protein
MAEHPHIELVRRQYQALSSGDTATLQQLYTRDCVVHLPGNHPLAGEHKGRDAVVDAARRMREETNGTLRFEPPQLFLDGRGHVIAMTRMTAERKGRRHDAARATGFTIVGDQIASIEVHEPDLDQTNDFWG